MLRFVHSSTYPDTLHFPLTWMTIWSCFFANFSRILDESPKSPSATLLRGSASTISSPAIEFEQCKDGCFGKPWCTALPYYLSRQQVLRITWPFYRNAFSPSPSALFGSAPRYLFAGSRFTSKVSRSQYLAWSLPFTLCKNRGRTFSLLFRLRL